MIHGRSYTGWRLLAAVGLAVTALVAHAQNAIESLNVSQQGASVGALTVPYGNAKGCTLGKLPTRRTRAK